MIDPEVFSWLRTQILSVRRIPASSGSLRMPRLSVFALFTMDSRQPGVGWQGILGVRMEQWSVVIEVIENLVAMVQAIATLVLLMKRDQSDVDDRNNER
jgi:hypothetical protein